jgi:hypothetical protein
MDYNNLSYHPTMEDLVKILQMKTQNENPIFFRLMTSYFFAKMASMMRVTTDVVGQKVPVNMYAINLAPSGSGKGHSINIMEDQVINNFRNRFLEQTFEELADENLNRLCIRRANRYGTDPDNEAANAAEEFESMGPMLFSFDSGTSAAIKQMRVKLLMAGAGSMNLEIDEIGSNLLGNQDVLNSYLELYDTGKIKQKLVKNTRDNVRSEDMFGSTPTNMLLFGTPTKLLNGGKTEEEFYDFLEVGYARRCFFGFNRYRRTDSSQTAKDLYEIYQSDHSAQLLETLSEKFGLLADRSRFAQHIEWDKDETMALLDYRLHCQHAADKLSEYDEVKKAEMAHRYFKVAKQAATYAFIDSSPTVTADHLENAIALAEDSGEAFSRILKRERPYVKLANYLGNSGREMTQADLVEDLPFYKGTEAAKREMMTLAIAHGYKNNIYIKREIMDGIEFLSGKSVPVTDLQKIRLAYSDQITEGYRPEEQPFSELYKLVTQDGLHWVSHHLLDGYRREDNAIPGVNMIVLDVEKSIPISTAQMLLKDYTYLLHTTKRHTDEDNRYRIIMPISHTLELDAREFKEFMNNIFDWLPFEVDRATGQRSRKWLTCNGKHWYNDGETLDALQFVPKTKKAEERRAILLDQTNLTNFERWFVNNTSNGNRNGMLVRYAFALIDMGQDFNSISNNVLALNKKLPEPLDEREILSTVLASTNQRLLKRGQA